MRLAIAFALPALLFAAEPIQVSWERTPEALAGHWVAVTLTGGTRLEGYWASVTPDAFTMQVEKSSDRRVYPRGLQTISRGPVIRIQAGKRRVRGRVIGALAGFYGVALTAMAASRSPDALQGPAGVTAWGVGILGFFVGRSWDRSLKDVVVVSGPAPPRI